MKHLTSNKGLTTLFLLTLLMGLAAAVFLVRQPQLIDKKAAVPPGSGTTTIKLSPVNPSVYLTQSPTITATINTGSTQIRGFQIIMSYTYTTATAPLQIAATQVTPLESALSNCLTNYVTHNTAAKKYTIGVSCLTPVGAPAYTTSGQDKQIFAFATTASAIGEADFVFDNTNSKVTSATDASDVLIYPTGTRVSVIQDTQPPAQITNLSTANITLNSFTINWTAPADTGINPQVASYEIRRSNSQISEANWSQATIVSGPTTPTAPGTNQSQAITGLNPNTTYYVAVKARDVAGNQSALSNVATALTLSNPSLNITLKLQGINSNKPAQNLQVILKQGSTTTNTFNGVSATANAQGVYSASIANVNPGTYDVYIKGPYHLRKKISGITLATPGNTQNWPGTPPVLATGDVTGDNFIDISDYSILAIQYSPGEAKNVSSDLNLDGVVDIEDYSLLANNFAPGVSGD